MDKQLALIVIVAILIRVAVAFALGDSADPISGAYDQISYDTLAQSLLQGHGFSFPMDWYPFTRAGEPTAHWSFLYTLYLAGVYALFGHHPLVARLIQILLSSLNIVLIYRIGRLLFGEIPGLIAAGLTALYAYLIFFSAALMTQTFYVLALLLALDAAMELSQNPDSFRIQKWTLLGAALGIATLLRQSILLFTPILFIWLIYAIRSPRGSQRMSDGVDKQKVFGVFISVAMIAAFILPWSVRNYLVYHDFLLLNSNGGYWFYSSNHPDQGTNFDPSFVAPVPQALAGSDEPALDRALYREALGFISADPVRFILLTLNRTKDYFWLLPSENSSLISNLSRLFSFTIYFPFMLCGLYLSRKQWRACLPLFLYVGFDTTLSLISWSAPRYRLPSDAVMMVFGGLAVTTLAERVIIQRWFTSKSAIEHLQSKS
jgi:4-amino-4-deoxy-L-arabinose transferase-like glycosyltransferase